MGSGGVSKLNSCSPDQVARSEQANPREGNASHPYVPAEPQLNNLYVDLPENNPASEPIDPRRLSVGTRTALALVRSTEEDEKEAVKVTIFGEETMIRPRLLSENTQLVLALAASQEDCTSPRQKNEQFLASLVSPVNPEWEDTDQKLSSACDLDPNLPSSQIITASAPPNEKTDSEADGKSESFVILKSSEPVPTGSKNPSEENNSKELKSEELERQESVVCSIEERRPTIVDSDTPSDSKPQALEFEMKVLKVNVQRRQEIEMNVFKSDYSKNGKRNRKRSSISWSYSATD